MSEQKQVLDAFINEVKESQTLWALQAKGQDDWVVLDSVNYQDSEVMPLWSSQQLAQVHCVDEWQEYIPAQISLADWLEFWIEDLNEDGIIIGVNWQDEQFVEVELAEFSQAIAQVEKL